VLYLSLMAMEWGLVLYVWRVGLRGDSAALRDVIGGRWRTARDIGVDVALALGTWGVWTAADGFVSRWAGASHAASVRSWLPRGPLEVALWVALSVSAGFSEELVFRGYLQRQFRAWTGSTAFATVLQAALFGISHGYQGLRASFAIAGYALLFTALASWRRTLRPGMLAHAWTDIASGVFRL
jgi:membrane protease YdiL (CAAX protease family)